MSRKTIWVKDTDENTEQILLDGSKIWFDEDKFWRVQSHRSKRLRTLQDQTELKEHLYHSGFFYLVDL